jgi:hypothetical protein
MKVTRGLVEHCIAVGVASTLTILAFPKVLKLFGYEKVDNTDAEDIDEEEILPDDDYAE